MWTDVAAVAASLSKIELTEVLVSEEEAKSKEFKAKSLTGKFPTLETPEGTLVESAAIARYLARLSGSGLGGNTDFERAQIDQFVDFAHSSLVPHMYNIYRGVFGHGVVEADTFNNSSKELKDLVRLLNDHLQGKEYLVGGRLTVADIVVAFALIVPFQAVLDGGFRKSVAPNVTAWIERFLAVPEVVRRVGFVKLCAKALKAVAPPKKEEKKEAPKPAAKATNEDGEVIEKKKTDPLIELPASPFDLFAFKTFYVNHADRKGEGLKFFWENLDKSGYCLYYAKYEKYEGEGVILYQTSNLLNGFLQRLDHFRKHTIGLMAITGEEPSLEIESVWLFRGKGIPEQMIEHPQWEYYQQRELNPDNEDDKKLFSDFISAKVGDVVNGRAIIECKLHK